MIKIDILKFKAKFPEFKDLSQEDIEIAYLQIGSLISPKEDQAVLNNTLREQGVYLATAIICKETLNMLAMDNQQIGTIASASEGSDSVSFQGIPYKTMLEWDLTNANIQPYGKALLRILKLAQPKLPISNNYNVPYYNIKQGI